MSLITLTIIIYVVGAFLTAVLLGYIKGASLSDVSAEWFWGCIFWAPIALLIVIGFTLEFPFALGRLIDRCCVKKETSE
jgi:uncharacterized membrane protein YoaK (UPF0700 family)